MILAEDDTEKLGRYQVKIRMEREPIRSGTILADGGCLAASNFSLHRYGEPSIKRHGPPCATGVSDLQAFSTF
jgi:hypothetical protein